MFASYVRIAAVYGLDILLTVSVASCRAKTRRNDGEIQKLCYQKEDKGTLGNFVVVVVSGLCILLFRVTACLFISVC